MAEDKQDREVVFKNEGDEKTVSFLFEKAVKGSLNIKAVDENGNDITENITFTVKQGEEVINQFREIKLGEYTIKVNYNEESYKLQEGQENSVTVSLNKDNKDVEYTFKFNKVK